MSSNSLPRIGIIGAGRLGTALARQSLKAGYEVRISNARGPESLELLLGVLLPGAIAATVDVTVVESDIIILALPLREYKTLDPKLFNRKVVIDAMNYWAPVEGHITEFAQTQVTSSELVQAYLDTACVVKALNHVAYNELEEQASSKGALNQRAIGIAGDDDDTKQQVKSYIEHLGFAVVDVGGLKNGALLQPDTQLFNTRLSAKEMRSLTTNLI